MEGEGAQDITTLLIEWSKGNRTAFDELTPLVYDQLHELAARALRHERPNHTLQCTALVHEAYLKLIDQRRVQWNDREHFFAVAAKIIRRILVSHARGKNALKRGGEDTIVSLDESIAAFPEREVELVALDDALESLSSMDPQQGRIVELRFFGGLSIDGVARVIGVSPSTVSREWDLARAWLRRELMRMGGTNSSRP